MKRTALAVLALIAALTLGACGTTDPATRPAGERTAVVGTPVAETPGEAAACGSEPFTMAIPGPRGFITSDEWCERIAAGR